MDAHFFDQLGEDVQSEMKKEDRRERRISESLLVSVV